MASQRILLFLAQAHAADLRTPHAPTTCPACLILFAYEIRDTKASMLWLRTNCHEFFDALMAFLTAGWTAAQRASARSALRLAQANCCVCALTDVTPKDGADEFEVAWEAAVLAVGFALADLQWGRTDKGFGSFRGRWPVSSGQLFPRGPERALGALVDLWEDGVASAMTLGDLAGAHWPLVYPVLSNANNRPRIMRSIVSHARSAASAMQEKLSKLPQPVTPGVQDIVNEQVTACMPWLRLLKALIYNNDATDGDRPQFFHGYEAELLAPMHALLSKLDGAPHGLSYLMARFATEFRTRLAPAQRAAVGCFFPPPYTCAVAADMQRDLADPYRALLFVLPQQTLRRECHGPGCGTPVHDKATPGAFPCCARCGVARYCSRACQRADWERAPRPHKRVCAPLRRLFSFADMEMDGEQFAAACRVPRARVPSRGRRPARRVGVGRARDGAECGDAGLPVDVHRVIRLRSALAD